jgi:tetratricopeptide (TPR) repeat protein
MQNGLAATAIESEAGNQSIVETLNDKGDSLNDLGRYEEAITYYDKALSIEPNDILALSNKGIALDDLGNYTEAIEYYDRSLEIDPSLSEVTHLSLPGKEAGEP